MISGGLCPALAKRTSPGRDIKDGAEHRREHAAFIVRCENLVDGGKHLVRFAKPLAFGLQQGFGHHHVQRGGDPLVGNVRNQETQILLVNEKEIIEVAPDLFGGNH